MRDFKFYTQYYVGIEKSRYETTDNQRLLGFATPIDTTSAYQKRKETVDRWRDDTIQPLIIENTPTFGFEIVDVVSRYKTDNKLYRIFDPRGFELEISAENLFDLIMNTSIVKGKIMEPLVWARFNSKNYLVIAASEEYKYHMNPKKAAPPLAVGQYFTHPTNETIVYRYEGRFNYITLDKDYIDTYNPSRDRYSYNRQPKHPSQLLGGIRSYIKYEVKTDHKEPYDVYTEFKFANDTVMISVHLRKSKLKDLVYIGDTHENKDITEFKIPVGVYLAQHQVNFGTVTIENNRNYSPNRLDYIVAGYGNSPSLRRHEIILYKTRAEAKTYKINIKEANELFQPLVEFEYCYGGNPKPKLVQTPEIYGIIRYELFENDELIEELE